MKKAILFLALLVITGSVHAGTYMGVMKGIIKGVYPVYKDADEVTMQAGYGECNGNYFELTTPQDLDLYSALPYGEDFVYIYVDDSASNYPAPTFIGDIIEPAWSDVKLGWYNGDDRCVGVVWSPDTGKLLAEFSISGETRYRYHPVLKQVLSNGNPDGTWNTISTSGQYTPVQTLAICGYAFNNGNGRILTAVAPEGHYFGPALQTDGYSRAQGQFVVYLPRGSSRNFSWAGDDDDGNSFIVDVRGYEIER